MVSTILSFSSLVMGFRSWVNLSFTGKHKQGTILYRRALNNYLETIGRNYHRTVHALVKIADHETQDGHVELADILYNSLVAGRGGVFEAGKVYLSASYQSIVAIGLLKNSDNLRNHLQPKISRHTARGKQPWLNGSSCLVSPFQFRSAPQAFTRTKSQERTVASVRNLF